MWDQIRRVNWKFYIFIVLLVLLPYLAVVNLYANMQIRASTYRDIMSLHQKGVVEARKIEDDIYRLIEASLTLAESSSFIERLEVAKRHHMPLNAEGYQFYEAQISRFISEQPMVTQAYIIYRFDDAIDKEHVHSVDTHVFQSALARFRATGMFVNSEGLSLSGLNGQYIVLIPVPFQDKPYGFLIAGVDDAHLQLASDDGVLRHSISQQNKMVDNGLTTLRDEVVLSHYMPDLAVYYHQHINRASIEQRYKLAIRRQLVVPVSFAVLILAALTLLGTLVYERRHQLALEQCKASHYHAERKRMSQTIHDYNNAFQVIAGLLDMGAVERAKQYILDRKHKPFDRLR